MYIKRHIEETIKEVAKNYPAVIVTGPRQVGKSTVLSTICGDIKDLTFDDPELVRYAVENGRMFFQTYNPPLLLDEVQYAPELFSYIKMLVDKDKKAGQFYMTGSQSFHLMKNVNESLAGRVGVVELNGLSMREILRRDTRTPFLPADNFIQQIKTETIKLNNNELWEIIRKGSMPAIYDKSFEGDALKQFYANYIRTYMERDVRTLSQIGDERAFYQFLSLVASNTAQMLNFTQMASNIGKDVKTVQAWISILRASGLVYFLEPYSSNINKRIIKTPKIYFMDTGLASYLTGWHTAEQLQTGAFAGAIFETFVVTELIKGYNNKGLDTRLKFSYYRDKDGKEIDFIIENDGTLYPIEIKKTGNPNNADAKSFSVLSNEATKKLGNGTIIYGGEDVLFLKDGLTAVPVKLI
ncbi:MAG: ATP-binding protein [Christensenellaceae bacterium]|jgi:predicted AAA+ superfamily ATPase|nr:ATP-binding protein [Christensenellaceae bacterium]